MGPHESMLIHAARRRPLSARSRWLASAGGLVLVVGALTLAMWPAAPARPTATGIGPGVGQRAPDLRLPDLQGHLRRLAAWRGHPVVVVFLASWCEGCRDEMPALVRASHALHRRGLVVLGVDAAGEPSATVARFARSYHVPFPILLDPSSGAMTTFAVQALPTTIIIGTYGRIVAHREAPVDEATLRRAAFGYTR